MVHSIHSETTCITAGGGRKLAYIDTGNKLESFNFWGERGEVEGQVHNYNHLVSGGIGASPS